MAVPLTVTVTVEAPGVPLIRPPGLMSSPAERPVAVWVSGLPTESVAWSWMEVALPTVLFLRPGLPPFTVYGAFRPCRDGRSLGGLECGYFVPLCANRG